MAALTAEEENCQRVHHLLYGVGVEAVRTTFDKYFPPASLQSSLQTRKDELKRKRILTKNR